MIPATLQDMNAVAYKESLESLELENRFLQEKVDRRTETISGLNKRLAFIRRHRSDFRAVTFGLDASLDEIDRIGETEFKD